MMKYTLDYEMSIGVKFEVENVTETVKESYTSQITHEIQTSYTSDWGVDVALTCTAPPEGGAGLWQWV